MNASAHRSLKGSRWPIENVLRAVPLPPCSRGQGKAARHARFDARLIGRTEVIAIDEVRRLALAEAAETGLAALAVRSDEYA